jgi:[acyl-carrier-protein] S-malonyltransferase
VKYAFGHSMGEYTALTAAEVLDPFQTAKILHHRGSQMALASKGYDTGMMAIPRNFEEISDFIETFRKEENDKVLDIAAINSPKQFVVTGEAVQIEKVG